MYKILRGMSDIFGERAKKMDYIVQTASRLALNFGYEYIETPKLESSELFRRGVGDSSDVVSKEMYEFSDKSNNLITLRPEGTAGVVRSFIQNKFDKSKSIKKYFYYGSMFRYERPQKGRLREFHQFGIECFGIKNPYEDASIIILGNEILKELGIGTTLRLNTLGSGDDLKNYKISLLKFLNQKKEFLCDDCKNRIDLNPLRALDCKNKNCKAILKDAPLIYDFLSPEAKGEFQSIQEILKDNKIDFILDPFLVRGLDYYSDVVFEFVLDELTLLGGGRYDKLVSEFKGEDTPGIGFGLGIERLADIINLNEKSKNLIYICTLNEYLVGEIFNIGIKLRENFKVFISYEEKNLSKHLKNASKVGANKFLCMGEDEKKADEFWYKNLDTKEERNIKISDLYNFLKRARDEI